MPDPSLFFRQKQPKQQYLWIVLIVLVVLTGSVWFYYVRQRSSPQLPTSVELAVIDNRFGDLVGMIEILERIRLDISLLRDPRFTELEHTTSEVMVTPEEQGRPNPFAPF